MIVRKLKVKNIIIFVLLIVFLVVSVIFVSDYIKTHNSYEYKLEAVGYSETEIENILKNLKKEEVEKILKLKYNSALSNFIKEKYFIFKNLDKYSEYYSKNKSFTYNQVISIVNTGVDKDWYTDIKESKKEDNELILVNKFNKMSAENELEDIVKISSKYAYEGKYISESITESLYSMLDDAKTNGYTLVVSQGYRSYEDQENAYNKYKNLNGTKNADIYVARPGHSDYQTGLSFVLSPYKKIVSNAEESEEHKWILENAYKYGFIQRYPKDKEYLTGFNYDPWRLRYVGVVASNYIHNNDITFEEYYSIIKK